MTDDIGGIEIPGRTQRVPKFHEQKDTSTTTPAAGQIDVWDAAQRRWVPTTLDTLTSTFALTGDIAVTIAEDWDNWNPTGLATASRIRVIGGVADRNITGLVGGSDGRVIVLHNVGYKNIILKHNVTSTAANRFYCPLGVDAAVQGLATALLIYDSGTLRWRVFYGINMQNDPNWGEWGELAYGTGLGAGTTLGPGVAGQYLKTQGAGANPVWEADYYTVNYIIDGADSAITAGVKSGDIELPMPGVIEEWRLLADQSGSIDIQIWKDTYANFPPTVADQILTPTITAATKNQATGLVGTVAAKDILRFNVNGAATSITYVTVILRVRKT